MGLNNEVAIARVEQVRGYLIFHIAISIFTL